MAYMWSSFPFCSALFPELTPISPKQSGRWRRSRGPAEALRRVRRYPVRRDRGAVVPGLRQGCTLHVSVWFGHLGMLGHRTGLGFRTGNDLRRVLQCGGLRWRSLNFLVEKRIKGRGGEGAYTHQQNSITKKRCREMHQRSSSHQPRNLRLALLVLSGGAYFRSYDGTVKFIRLGEEASGQGTTLYLQESETCVHAGE